MPFLFMFNLQAEIFKCTNTKGAVYYNDKPCPVKHKQKKMKTEKDVVNGYVPLENIEKKPESVIKKRLSNNKNKEIKQSISKHKTLSKTDNKGNKGTNTHQNNSATSTKRQSVNTNIPVIDNKYTMTDDQREELLIDIMTGSSTEEELFNLRKTN